MADDITNAILLEHMQSIKHELTSDIKELTKKIDDFEESVQGEFTELREQLEDAKAHRNALQEDLEATILLQGKQQKQLQTLTA